MPDALDSSSVERGSPTEGDETRGRLASKRGMTDEAGARGPQSLPRRGSMVLNSTSPRGKSRLESIVRKNSVVLTTQSSSVSMQSPKDSPGSRFSRKKFGSDDPFSESNSKSRLFHRIQEEIRESVERADQTLAEYDLNRPPSAMTEETDEQPTSPLPEDLTEIVPAAERFAMMQLGQHHHENMNNLVSMYTKFEDFMAGNDEADKASEKEVNEIFADILAHRNAVVGKVQAARDAARAAAEALAESDDSEPETPVEEMDTEEVKEDAGAPLKEHLRHLESRITDLQEELEEEHDNYQKMEEAKDQMIKSLRSQLVDTENQMQDLVGRTAGEIADSASQVEDTRLHIAYLTLQLRNARELAAQRVFDAEKWISRDDYEALVVENEALKIQIKKLQDRVALEQKNTAEAHEYGRKCLRLSHQAEEKHAAWELRLRDTLKERDRDLVKLNYETRLLQSRADRMLHDFEEKKKQIQADSKDEVQKAVQAMEHQRSIFNVKLMEKDTTISQLKGKCDDLRDQLSAKTLVAKQVQKKVKSKEVMHYTAETQTDITLARARMSEEEVHQGTQTADVRGSLWRVARRRIAIKALSSLDKKNKTMKAVYEALRAWQTETEAQWETSREQLAAAVEALERRNEAAAEVSEGLLQLVERLKRLRREEPSVDEKRARLSAALSATMHAVQPALSGVMSNVGESLRWAVRLPSSEAQQAARPQEGEAEISADDAKEFKNMMSQLAQVKQAAAEAVEESKDVLAQAKATLYGEASHHINTALATLEHEMNVVARGELSKHEQVLTAIKSGVSVDDRIQTPWAHGSAAGLDILAGQKAESHALADIISAWNLQRNDWVKERYKLTQESKELRGEIQRLTERVDELRRNAAAEARPDPLRGKWDDPGRMKAELEAYKTLGMEVEGPMREVAGGIVRWWERASGVSADVTHVAQGEAPSIFEAGVLLLQAACMAVARAKELEKRPETGEAGQQVEEEELRRELGIEVETVQTAEAGLQAEEPRAPSVQRSDKSTAMSRRSSSTASAVPAAEPEEERVPSVVSSVKPESVPEEASAPSQALSAELQQQGLALLKIMGRTAARVRGSVGLLQPGGIAHGESSEEEEKEGEEEEEEEAGTAPGLAVVAEEQLASAEKDGAASTKPAATKAATSAQAAPGKDWKAKTATRQSGKGATAPGKHSAGGETKAKSKAKGAGKAKKEGGAETGSVGSKQLSREASLQKERSATKVQRWIRERRSSKALSHEESQVDILQEIVKLQVQAASEVEDAIRMHVERNQALQEEMQRLRADAAQGRRAGEDLAQQLREAEASVLALRQELAEAPHRQPPPSSAASVPRSATSGLELSGKLRDIDWETWEGLTGQEMPVLRGQGEGEGEGEGSQPARLQQVHFGFLHERHRAPTRSADSSEGSEDGEEARQGPSAVATWMTDMAASAAQKAPSGPGAQAALANRGSDAAEPKRAQLQAPSGRAGADAREGTQGPVLDESGWGGALARQQQQAQQSAAAERAGTPSAGSPPLVLSLGDREEGSQQEAHKAPPPAQPPATEASSRRSSGARGGARSGGSKGSAHGAFDSDASASAEPSAPQSRQPSRGSRTSARSDDATRHAPTPPASGSGSSRQQRGESGSARSEQPPAESPALPSAPSSRGTRGSSRGLEGAQRRPSPPTAKQPPPQHEAAVEMAVDTQESQELTSSDVILSVSAAGFSRQHGKATPQPASAGMRDSAEQTEDEIEVIVDIIRRRYAALLRDKDAIIEKLRAQIEAAQHQAPVNNSADAHLRELKARKKEEELQKEVSSLKEELEQREEQLKPIMERLKHFDALQEQVVEAQKEVAAMGAMTSKMANDLVQAREQARFHQEYAGKMQKEAQQMVAAKAELEETIAELTSTLSALPPSPPSVERGRSAEAPAPRKVREVSPRSSKKARRQEEAGLGTGSVSTYRISSDGARIMVLDELDDHDVESVEQLMQKVDEEFGDLQAGRKAILDLFASAPPPPPVRSRRTGSRSPRKGTSSGVGAGSVPALPIESSIKPHPPPSGSLSQRGRRLSQRNLAEGAGEDGGRAVGVDAKAEVIDKLPVLFPPTLPSARRRTPR